jgi:transmembrane sensor
MQRPWDRLRPRSPVSAVRNTQSDSAPSAHAEAALWHERMTAALVDTEVRDAFERWLAASPAHARAYADVDAIWKLGRETSEAPAILALRHETATRMAATTRGLVYRLGLAAAMLIATLSGAGLAWYMNVRAAERAFASQAAGEVYQTRIGERMTLTLMDGSTATLNTASRLRVNYSDSVRHLTLESGQAIFDVAKGQPRPFVVSAGSQTITAHGTEFDVRLEPENVQVALIEGIVSVRRKTSPSAPEVRLSPGEVLSAGANSHSVQTVRDMKSFVSWRDGLLIFDDESLADAVTEMNRYVERPIMLADQKLGKLRISGAFHAGGTGTFVDAVTHLFPVAVVQQGPNAIVLDRASKRPGAPN